MLRLYFTIQCINKRIGIDPLTTLRCVRGSVAQHSHCLHLSSAIEVTSNLAAALVLHNSMYQQSVTKKYITEIILLHLLCDNGKHLKQGGSYTERVGLQIEAS